MPTNLRMSAKRFGSEGNPRDARPYRQLSREGPQLHNKGPENKRVNTNWSLGAMPYRDSYIIYDVPLPPTSN